MAISLVNALGTFTKKVESLVTIKPEVDSLFRSFFADSISAAEGCDFEVIRSGRTVFNDVDINSEPVITKLDKSSRKIFIPPAYNPAVQLSAIDAFQRVAGSSEYVNDRDFVALVDKVAREMQHNIDAMERTEELLCSKALTTGVVTTKHGDDVDFKRRAASIIAYNAAHGWDVDTIDPSLIMIQGAKFMAQYGMINYSDMINVFVGEEAALAFENNPIVQKKADIRNFNGVIEVAPGVRMGKGATPIGYYKTGGYNFRIWTYAGKYKHPDTGVETSFLDPKKIVMLPTSQDFKMFYGGVPAWNGSVSGFGRLPGIQKGKRVFYQGEDEMRVQKIYGFRTRPLPILREVDKVFTAQVVAS